MQDTTAGRLGILSANRARANQRRRSARAIFDTEHQLLLDLNARLGDAVTEGRLEVCGRAWRRYVDLVVTPQIARQQESHMDFIRSHREYDDAAQAHNAALERAGIGVPTEYARENLRRITPSAMVTPYRPPEHSYAEERHSVERRIRQLREAEAQRVQEDAYDCDRCPSTTIGHDCPQDQED